MKKNIKTIIGILISALFMYLALRKVDFKQMIESFARVEYWYLLPAVFVIFFSHWLRAVRWKFLMEPIARVKLGRLFSALLIGYMGNAFLPAHLGELFRAYIVGKKEDISPSTVFGTIIVERIIDVFSLLLFMGITIIVFPFPAWVRNSGYIFLAVIIILSVILVMMKIYRKQSLDIISKLIRPLPSRWQARFRDLFNSLLDGIVPLRKKGHYIIVFILTLLIWLCYAVSFQVVFYAFDFVKVYSLPWNASLVLLVITTISVLVPSSPGYVGTYHYLCQLSLGFFSVPPEASLSYAIILHGLNFFPIIIIGLVLVSMTRMNLKSLQKESEHITDTNQDALNGMASNSSSS